MKTRKKWIGVLVCSLAVLLTAGFFILFPMQKEDTSAQSEPVATPLAQTTYATRAGYQVQLGDIEDGVYWYAPFVYEEATNTYTPNRSNDSLYDECYGESAIYIYFSSSGRFDFAFKFDPDKAQSNPNDNSIDLKYYSSCYYDDVYGDETYYDRVEFCAQILKGYNVDKSDRLDYYFEEENISSNYPLTSYDLPMAELRGLGETEQAPVIQNYFKGGDTWCHFTLDVVAGARITIIHSVNDFETEENGFAFKILDCVDVKADVEGNGQVQYKNTKSASLEMSWEKGAKQTLTAVPTSKDAEVVWTNSKGERVGEGLTLETSVTENETFTAHFLGLSNSGFTEKSDTASGKYYDIKSKNGELTYTFMGEKYVTFQYSYLWSGNTAKAFTASLDGHQFVAFQANNGSSGKLGDPWTDLTVYAKGDGKHTLTISFTPKSGDTTCELGIRNFVFRTTEEMEAADMMVTVPIEYNERLVTMTMFDGINEELVSSGDLRIAKYRYVSFTATKKENVPAEFAPGTYENILFQSWDYGGYDSSISGSNQVAQSTTSLTIYFDGANIFEQKGSPAKKGQTSTLKLDVRAIAPLGDIYLMITDENNSVVQQKNKQGELVDQLLIEKGDSLTAIYGVKYTYTFMVPTLETLKGEPTTLTGSVDVQYKDERLLKGEFKSISVTIEDQDGYDYYVTEISGSSGSESFRFIRSIDGYCNSNINPDGSTDYSDRFTINFKTAEEKVTIGDAIDERSKEFVSITAQSPDPWIVDLVHSGTDYYAFKPSNITANAASKSSLTFDIANTGILYFRCFFICSGVKYSAANVKLESTTLLQGSGYTTPNIVAKEMVESGYIGSTQIYECNVPVTAGKNTLNINLGALDNSNRNSCFAIWDIKFFEEKNITVKHKASDDLGETYGTTSYTGTPKSGKTLTFTATPAEGSNFYGWVDNTTGELISEEKQFTYTPIYEDALDFTAYMAPEGKYAARQGGHFYTTLEEALEKTKGTGSFGSSHIKKTVIYLLCNYELSGGEVTIPENVMLVVPYDAAGNYDGTGGLTRLPSSAYSSWNGSTYKDPFRTLTIPTGTTLKIKGTLMLGGILGDSYQGAQGHTSAYYSQVILDGDVVVESGGAFDVRGLVTGEGHIEVKGTVDSNGQGTPGLLFQPFLILDYNGGTNAYDTFNAGLTPFKMYAMVNIQCAGGYTINYGGVLYGHSSLHSGYGYTTRDQVFIGYEGKIGSSYASKISAPIYLEKNAKAEVKYNPDHAKVGKITDEGVAEDEFNFYISNLNEIGQTTITITGGATTGYMDFSYVNTSKVYFAIPYNYNYILKSGNFTIASLLKFMPGSSLTVEEDAILTVDPSKADANVVGVGLHIYDSFLIPGLNGLDKRTYPSGKMLEHAEYKSYASFIVNGKFVVKAGASFVGTIQNTNGTAQHVSGKGEIVIEKGAKLQEDLYDGVATIYSCNYTKYTLKAQIWDKVHSLLCDLEAGHSYYATDGEATFTLPGIEFQIEQNVDEAHAHRNKTHTLLPKTTPSVEGLTGSWMVVHDTHEFPGWEKYNPTAEDRIVKAEGTCTALGCGETESSYLLYAPETIGALGYSGKAYGQDDVLQLMKDYYGTLADTVKVSVTLNVDAPTNAGEYTVSVTLEGAYFKDGAGYTKTKEFKWSIGKAELTAVTVEGEYTYNGKAQTPQVTVKAGDLILKEGEYKVAATNNKDASDAASVTVEATSPNYTGKLTATFKIAAKEITVTLEEQSAVYTGKKPVVSSNNSTNWNVESGEIYDSFAALGIELSIAENAKAAAKYKIEGTCGNKNYKANFTEAYFTIEKKAIEVQARGGSSVYGEEVAELTWTVAEGQLVDGDSEADLQITLDWKDGKAPKNAGDYTIAGTGEAANYEITVKEAKYTVTKKGITVTAEDKSTVYGAELAELTWTVAEGELVEGDTKEDLHITLKRNSISLAAGTYRDDIVKESAEADNYEITVTAGTYTIAKKPIEITLKEQRTTYNGSKQYASGESQNWTVQKDALAYEDSAEELVVTLTAFGTEAGSYAIEGSIGNENYEAAFSAANFVIEQLSIESGEVVGFKAQVEYNGRAQEFAELKVQVGVLQATIETKYESNHDAGTAKVTITGTGNFCGEIEKAFTITQKAITVTIKDQGKTYDGQAGELDGAAWTYSPALCEGDGADALEVTLSAELGKDHGEYRITGSGASKNYKVTFRGETNGQEYGKYTIEKAAATLTIAPAEREYGEENALTFTVSGLVAGENIDGAVTLITKAEKKSPVGDYEIEAQIAEDHEIAKNYTVTWEKGTLKVTARKIAIVIHAQSGTYTGQKPGVSSEANTDWEVTSGSIAEDDDLGVELTIQAAEKYHQGTYTLKGEAKSEAAKNYAITWTEGTYTVAAKEIAVQIRPQSAEYTGRKPAVSSEEKIAWAVETGAIVEGDDAKITLSIVEKDGAWGRGTYDITAECGNTDYTVKAEKGENAFTITPKDIKDATVTVAEEEGGFVYKAAAWTPEVTVTLENYSNVTFETSYQENTNAGTARVTVSGTGNYAGTAEATFEIKPKDIAEAVVTVTEQEGGFVYRNAEWTPAVTVTLAGYGAVTTYTATYRDNKNAGKAYVTVEGTGNYTGTAEATFEIGKKAITVTAESLNSAYGETVKPLAFHVEGLFDDGNDVEAHIVIGCEVSEQSPTGTYTITVQFEEGYEPKNYAATFQSGTYTVTAAEFSGIGFESVTLTYDGTYHKPEVTGAPEGAEIEYRSNGEAFTGAREVGTYEVTATVTLENYTAESLKATLTIQKKHITVEIGPQEADYSGAEPEISQDAWTVMDDGLCGTDERSVLNVRLTKERGTDAKTYEIAGTYESRNYEVAFEKGTFTIKALAVTVEIKPQSSVYNKQIPEVSSEEGIGWERTAGTVLEGESLGVVLALKDGAADAGIYDIEADWTNKNYALTILGAEGAYEIEAKALSVRIEDQYGVYNGKEPEVAQGPSYYRVTGGEPESGDELGVKLKKAAGAGYRTEGYAITGEAENKNYSVTFTAGVYHIAKKSITVTLQNQQGEYSGERPEADQSKWSVAAGAVENGDDLRLRIAIGDAAKYNAGVYKLSAVSGNANYSVTFTPATYTITKRNVTVQIGAQSGAYTGRTPQLSAEQGRDWTLSDGTIAAGDDLGIELEIEAAEKYHAGNYTLTGTWRNTNYNVTFGTGTYTVTKKGVEVRIGKSASVGYNGEAPTLETEIWTVTGLADGDGREVLGVTLHVVGKGGAWNAGVYEIDGEAAARDYDVTFVKGSVTIERAKVTVEVTAHKAVYTGTAPEFGAVYGTDWTLKSGEIYKEDDLGITLTTTHEHAGKYTLDGGYTNENYAVTFTGGALEIVAKEIEVQIGAQSSVYGESITVKQDAYEAEGVAAGDDLEVTLTKTGGRNAGKYDITGRSANTDYAVTFKGGTGAYTIEKRKINVTILDQESVYGDRASVDQKKWQAGAGEIVGNDDLKIVLSKEAGDEVREGGYAIVGSYTNENYEVTFEGGRYTIKPRAVTVTPNGGKAEYNGQEPKLDQSAWKVTEGSRVSGDDLEVTLTLGAGDHTAVGKYAIAGSAGNKNYAVTFAAGEFEVTARKITVTLKDQTAEYNGQEPVPDNAEWEDDGRLLDGDDLHIVLAKDAGTEAGSYTIRAEYRNDNYSVVFKTGLFRITARKITVTIADQTAVYNGREPAVLQTAWDDNGMIVGNDELNIVLTKQNGHTVGEYTITGGYTNKNYDVTFKAGTFRVTPKAITVTIADQTAGYDGKEPALEQGRYDDGGGIEAVDEKNIVLSLVAKESWDAGEYEIAGTFGNENYTVTWIKGTFTITPREITVRVADQTAEYTGKEPEPMQTRWEAENAVAGDDLKIVLVKEAGTDAGEYALGGVCGNTNYRATFIGGTFTISKRDIGETIVLAGENDNGTVVLEYTGADIALTAFAEAPVRIVLDPPALKETGSYTVTATVEDKNYCGSKEFAVVVKLTAYSENLVTALRRLEEIAGDLTAEELTAEDFDTVKEIAVTLASLTEEERTLAEEELARYTALIDAWNAEIDEEVIETAHMTADALISGLFVTTALAALAYVMLRRKF